MTRRIGSFESHYAHGCKNPGSHRYLSVPVLALCREYGTTRKVIDIGCGNGALCRDLSTAGFEVTGVEPSESGIRCAREVAPLCTFFQLGVYDDPAGVPGTDFDLAVSTEVIEHLYSPSALLVFAREKLRDGGHIVLSTPYHGWLKNVLIGATGRWDTHHVPRQDGGHIKFFSRASLTVLLRSHGFEPVAFRGVGRTVWLWKSMILVARKCPESP